MVISLKRFRQKTNLLIKRFYFSIRNNEYIYLNIVNFKSKKELKSLQIIINEKQSKVLEDLKSDGISIIDYDDMFDRDIFTEMCDFIADNEENLKAKGKKKFLQSYFGTDNSELALDLLNPFVKFYLSKNLLEIVSMYLEYVPQLFEIYVEKTIPVGDEKSVFSQNWHRDPQEKRTLKVFLYLSDVTEFAGPFVYLKGSAPTSDGKYKKIFHQRLPNGSYPNEEDLHKKINDKDLLIATGKKGTVIFCDTSGLHRGGYATSQHRIMATGFFPSKAYTIPRRFSVNVTGNSSDNSLPKIAKKVLDLS